MEMILRLTPGDSTMIQIWIKMSHGELLAGVMHEDCFSEADFIDDLMSSECDELTVTVTKADN